MRQEVAEGAANWDVMTNRYFDTVEQLDILNKADEFLREVSETCNYSVHGDHGHALRSVASTIWQCAMSHIFSIAGPDVALVCDYTGNFYDQMMTRKKSVLQECMRGRQ